MAAHEPVNILLVDDQKSKLLSYEVILRELGENLLIANSAGEAFEHLLKTDVAVVLVDVCMPDLDGFELAGMIRDHPRFQKTAIIFISAVLLTDLDFQRGYELGAVDYVPVPVVPEILRAKVKVFAELYRKTRQLENLNRELEQRVTERTAALEASSAELRRSEERLRLALDAARMGWWDYDIAADQVTWSPSLERIMGFSPADFGATLEGAMRFVHPEDRERFRMLVVQGRLGDGGQTCELRFVRPDGTVRWSLAAGQLIRDAAGRPVHFAGVDLDITERKHAEDRQLILMRELDHRAKNMLAVVQSVLHLSRADTIGEFIAAVDGRVSAMSRAHRLLSEARWEGVHLGRIVEEEIAPFQSKQAQFTAAGPAVSLDPATAQCLAIVLHELTTNAVKHGALSIAHGQVSLTWDVGSEGVALRWQESGGPATATPSRRGFGLKVISGSIERQLGGTATFDWLPGGLDCRLSIPRPRVGEASRASGGKGRPEPVAPRTRPLAAGSRILLVEDEALIATMMKETLTDLGFAVVGPVSTIAQAMVAAREEPIDGAVLDINLAGQPIYPVADALIARSVPFVFVTGYTPEGIESRYAHVPALEKPIDPQMLRLLFAAGANHGGGVADTMRTT